MKKFFFLFVFTTLVVLGGVSYLAGSNNLLGNQTAQVSDSFQKAPVPPIGITANAESSTQVPSEIQVRLSWADSADNEDGFIIERSMDGKTFVDIGSDESAGFTITQSRGESQFTQIGTADENATSYVDVSTDIDTIYTYRIKAYNRVGNSKYSESVTIKAQAAIPNPPSNLVALSESASTVVLNWSDNANSETGFKIERAISTESFALIATVGKNATNFIDDTAATNTPYSYRVRAFNTTGESPFSNVVAVKTLEAAPTPPIEFTAVATSPTRITLTWEDASDNEWGFKIEREDSSLGEFVEVGYVPVNNTTYNDTGLDPEKFYSYRLRAYNDRGDSEYTEVIAVRTPKHLPDAPAHIEAVNVSHESITLKWEDNSINELGFEIEKSNDGIKFTHIATVERNGTQFVDNEIEPSNAYHYRIRAYNEAGHSPYSKRVIVVSPSAQTE
jgi:uncharacterized protein